MKLLLLLSIILSPLTSLADPAIKILCDSGLTHSIAQAKTIYADSGDHVFYKEAQATDGMLLLTEDGVVKFRSGNGNRVVVAIVKNYS
jgi:hypothetical protein